jgi:predicted RNA-binding Zn ribbon-like protein
MKSWGRGEVASRVFRDAVAVRKELRVMAERLANRRPAPRRSIDAVNTTIRKRPGCVLLARRSGHFEERTRLDLRQPDHLLVPIAQSASDLLCHGNLALVKRCANPACGAFFHDTSKNHNGRWCSKECGNRARVAAHYRRTRTDAQRAGT